jgi:hypothetical protein
VVNTGGGLLRDTVDRGKELGVLVVNKGGKVSSVVEDHVASLAVGEALNGLVHAPDGLLLGLTLPGEDGDTGGSDGSGGLVLGGEDLCEAKVVSTVRSRRRKESTYVARRPGNGGTESSEGLDEDGTGKKGEKERQDSLFQGGKVERSNARLDGHVEASGDCESREKKEHEENKRRKGEGGKRANALRAPLSGWEGPYFSRRYLRARQASQRMLEWEERGERNEHESGHLVLSENDLLATPGGKGAVVEGTRSTSRGSANARSEVERKQRGAEWVDA